MSFKDIKNKNQGFTIVELLIVVVVIAILAAITIVSYNGITNRANQSSAKATASTLQKKVELHLAEVGNYPIDLANLSGDSSKSYYVPATSFGNAAPTATSPTSGTDTKGTNYAQVRACAPTGTVAAGVTTSNITGIRIIYWSYGADGTSSTAPIEYTTLGSCSQAVVDL